MGNKNLHHRKTFFLAGLFLLLLILPGCFTTFAPGENVISAADSTLPPSQDMMIPSVPVATIPPEKTTEPGGYEAQSLPDGLRDELPVMSGICFESAYDAAGQVFVVRTAIEHIRLYGAADNSELCRRPVTRYPFDFTTGRVLAGLWSGGMGCTARHEVVSYERDDSAKTILLQLRFITEGNCSYELVRPFWVSIPDAADYEIELKIVP